MKRFRHDEKGFTLIELIIVIALLALLAAIAAPQLFRFLTTGEVAAGCWGCRTVVRGDRGVTTVQ